MAKGKLTDIKNVVEKIFNFISFLFSKLIEKVHFLDPKDNTKQRIITALVLIPIALYAPI